MCSYKLQWNNMFKLKVCRSFRFQRVQEWTKFLTRTTWSSQEHTTGTKQTRTSDWQSNGTRFSVRERQIQSVPVLTLSIGTIIIIIIIIIVVSYRTSKPIRHRFTSQHWNSPTHHTFKVKQKNLFLHFIQPSLKVSSLHLWQCRPGHWTQCTQSNNMFLMG